MYPKHKRHQQNYQGTHTQDNSYEKELTEWKMKGVARTLHQLVGSCISEFGGESLTRERYVV